MSRHKPIESWQIDFDQTLNWTSDHGDVTEVWLADDIMAGCNPALDGRGVRTECAYGLLTLWNGDNRYNPNSSKAIVDETKLRRRNPVRLVIDGVTAFEGIAEFQGVQGDGKSSTITFELSAEDRSRVTLRRKEMNHTGGTVSDVAEKAAELWGMNITAASDNPIGQIYYSGNALIFLDNLARYAGGWFIQLLSGGWLFVDYVRSAAQPSAAVFGLEYEPLDGYSQLERQGHIRNYAAPRATFWETSQERSLLAATEIRRNRHQAGTVRLVFDRGDSQQPLGWTDFAVSPDDVALFISSQVESNYVAYVSFQTLGYLKPPPQTVRVVGYGQVNRRKQSNPRELIITEGSTQETYGQQELLLPPWFPTGFANIADYLRPWLRNLSQGPEWLQITYREWQPTKAQSNALRDKMIPGMPVTHTIISDDQVVTYPATVMAVRLSRTLNNARRRTAYSLKRRAVPPAPLTATIGSISDRTAIATVGIPSFAEEQIYARHRTA